MKVDEIKNNITSETITVGNAAGLSIPLTSDKIISDRIRKDGVRLITYWRRAYINGYSAWKGFTLKKHYLAIDIDGKVCSGSTRSASLHILDGRK